MNNTCFIALFFQFAIPVYSISLQRWRRTSWKVIKLYDKCVCFVDWDGEEMLMHSITIKKKWNLYCKIRSAPGTYKRYYIMSLSVLKISYNFWLKKAKQETLWRTFLHIPYTRGWHKGKLNIFCLHYDQKEYFISKLFGNSFN